MKEIPLANSDQVALVDDEDYEKVKIYRWYLSSDGYAVVSIGKTTLRMHRLILGVVNGCSKQEVHHEKDENKLDNRKERLYLPNRSEHAATRGKRRNNKTGYCGVIIDQRTGKFQAQIKKNGKHFTVGRFKTAEEAAIAYNQKAIELYGKYAYQNPI